MWMNNKPITTTGINQQTTGIKIQGKKEAAYAPVISNSPIVMLESFDVWQKAKLAIDKASEHRIK